MAQASVITIASCDGRTFIIIHSIWYKVLSQHPGVDTLDTTHRLLAKVRASG
jgi:uncharacterized ferritin-like protein (DUF455 family)